MNRWAVGSLMAIAATMVFGASLRGQSADSVEAHVAAAKAAAGKEHVETLFKNLCPAPVAPAATNQGARARGVAAADGDDARLAGRRTGPPDPATWHSEPMKVFDNLYYVGQKALGAWAVTTSAGIIVIDSLFDYSVEDEIAGGLTKLGLDPANIKYVIITHGHADHAAGAKFLQEKYGAKLIMAEPDWQMVTLLNAAWKPRRDVVATDGQKLTLGDTTLTLSSTPGHTLGTLSVLIPVKDGRASHLVAEWGGTAFNFHGWGATEANSSPIPQGPTPDNYQRYIASSLRFADVSTQAGADAIISNHGMYDDVQAKIAALKTRRQGDPHPFVIGKDATKRYMDVVTECAKAGLGGVRHSN